MSLAQIEYFVAVAEEGHMGRAAQRLRVSQPPLTRQIRGLEDELGAWLFERTPRGMRLLPAGERFLGHARRVLAAVEEARCAVEPYRDRALASSGSTAPALDPER
jgi:DNA-binding transcriptional LysR family regulator